jgi:hypothetical protein
MSRIVDFASTAAADLASKFANEPEGEFIVWLQLALRREAMVAVAYDDHYIKARIQQLEDRGVPENVTEAIRIALASAWAQEKGHQHYLSAVLEAVSPPKAFFDRLTASLQDTLGQIEGRIIAALTSGDRFARARARLALSVGSLVQDVPDFVSAIGDMPFGGFAALNADLEETAIHGYHRMLELLAKLQGQSEFKVETTLTWDLKKMWRDETYHCALFHFLEKLFGDPPPPPSGASLAGASTFQAGVKRNLAEIVKDGISAAQLLAYQGEEPQHADAVIEITKGILERDPLITRLRRWVRIAYADAGIAIDVPRPSRSSRYSSEEG